MKRNIIKAAVFGILAGTSLHSAQAQDSGPLIDKLVQKGILNDQEAEELRADLVKDFNQTSAGKLNISSSITELKLYGDARYRWQYDDQQKQIANTDHVTQRSRTRFRLRLYADFKFTDSFFGGVGLETGKANDSGNQTVDPIFSDSNIYISKYFLGYNVGEWGTFVVGKQKNPFYSTELVWDTDINPVGFSEAVAFNKLFGYEETYESSGGGYSKDGKSVPPSQIATSHGFDWGNFELSFVAGQFVYNTDNNEEAADSDASNDVYLFEQQLVASYKWDSKTALTIAPALMFYNAGDLPATIKDGDLNSQPFTDATGISGESRDLLILDVPGEFKFPLGSFNAKFLWDFAYNFQGEDRFTEIYGINPALYGDQQSYAWLLGTEIGQGKGKGAWLLAVSYRETGISSIDPNLNDSDFALSRLNTRGFKIAASYSFTDFLTATVTAQNAYNIDDDLFGGQATTGSNLADRNAINIYQVDLLWKF